MISALPGPDFEYLRFSRLFQDHLAVPAVEVEGEFLAVVKEEERTALLGALMFRAHSQLVPYAVACAHEFGSFLVSELICLFNAISSG